ncbi:MAG: hypothetical protein QW590_03940 [Candidatus Bilamarchaeaceae archaeon]
MKEKDAKRLECLIRILKNNCVLVEGKRDKEALNSLGCSDAIPISGRIRQLREFIKAKKVIVATDLDRRGNQLAAMIKSELEGSAIVDCETRILLGRLLKLKYFEDIGRKYAEFCKEVNKNGKNIY